MNEKRMLLALSIGVLSGILCSYGTLMMEDQLNFTVTTGLLASIFYQRVLIGFVVGLVDSIKMNSVIRGALVGVIVGMAMSSISIVDGDIGAGITLLGFSAVYGIIADVVASKYGGS